MVYARVTHGLPKTRFLVVLWVVDGFWTGFYGVRTGFLRVFTVFLRVVDGFLLFRPQKSVKKCSIVFKTNMEYTVFRQVEIKV